MTNVELLRELVENRPVTVLVLLDDGGDQRNQLVPELQVVLPRPGVVGLLLLGCVLATGLLESGNRFPAEDKTFLQELHI